MSQKFILFLALTSVGGLASQLSNNISGIAYKYSNDTITLELANSMTNVLHGPVGSEHNLEFVLKNNAKAGNFTIIDYSEDGFTGILSSDEAYLNTGQQQTITTSRLKVPNRPEGTKIRYTITVERDSGIIRRKRQVGGGGGLDSDNENGNIQFPNFNFNNDHPSNRRSTQTSIEFTVTGPSEQLDDSRSPDIKDIKYEAEDKVSACDEYLDTNCDELWWLTFNIQDENSGLNNISVMPDGGNNDIFFKIDNFAYGTDDEVEVVAGASCCTNTMEIRVTDINGNPAIIWYCCKK